MADQRDEAVLREAYAAFNRRDIDAALASMDPDVEWPDMLEGRTLQGTEAVRDYWLRQWETIDSRVEPEEFVHAGDVVIVFVHQRVRPAGGREDEGDEARIAHVYWMREGRASRMEVWPDRDEALRKFVRR